MLLRQLFDQASGTYTHLLADEQNRQALLIDPVFEQHARDRALIRELEFDPRYVLDTHCHADHITGAWLMKSALGAQIGLSPAYQATHGDVIRFGACGLEVRAPPDTPEAASPSSRRDRERVSGPRPFHKNLHRPLFEAKTQNAENHTTA